MKPALFLLSLTVSLLVISTAWTEEPAPTKLETPNAKQPHRRQLSLKEIPNGKDIVVQGPLPSVLRASVDGKPLEFSFNKNATVVTFHLPEVIKSNETPTIELLVAENTSVLSDGTVVLSALDSEVIGKKAKLETHPGSHRIGFWGNPQDYVRWDLDAPAGDYTAELVYSRATPDGTEVEIRIGDTKIPLTLAKTGSWYRYRNVPLGDVTLPNGKQSAEVRVKRIVNGGVMNLKAIVLTPKK